MQKLLGNITPRDYIMNVLNGISVGVIVALIPGALLSELAKAMQWDFILSATGIAMAMMAVIVGFSVGQNFKFSAVQSGSIAVACAVGSGAVTANPAGGFIFNGTGDIINVTIVAAIAAFIILTIGEKLKAFTVLVVPSIVILVAGGIGMLVYPYIQILSLAIGAFVAEMMTLSPIIMSFILGITFAVMIISPISTVAIATAISISGVASGAANLGICACGFAMAIAGRKVNTVPTSIAHFFGSPKIQMANAMKKPQILLPIILSSGFTGMLAGIFGIEGTTYSAGFGFSGFIGPVNALALSSNGWTFSNIMMAIVLFCIVPVALGYLFTYIFNDKLGLAKPEDYYLDY